MAQVGRGSGRSGDERGAADEGAARDADEPTDSSEHDASEVPDTSHADRPVRLTHGTGTHRHALVLTLGHEELIIRRRYEAASIGNDVLIALWFLVGSVFFFFPAWLTIGTWCFVAGSVELLIRPLIRLSRQFHLQRFETPEGTVPRETAQDY